jgi:hypothetical protein
LRGGLTAGAWKVAVLLDGKPGGETQFTVQP